MNVALRPSLDILSLCTGGAGLDLGIRLAVPSARAVCMVEREAFAVAHLVAAMEQGLLHPAPIWSDARTFDGRPWRGAVDGVIGGIPCQPHSLAGKREGSDDERDLWSDARRIIVQSRPWFVLIENVEGMLSAKPGLDPGALRVRRDLQRLGFDVEGGLFTAAEVGASHERERVFILGISGVGQADASLVGRGEGRPEPSFRSGRHTAASASEPVVDAVGSGYDRREDDALGRSGERAPSEGAGADRLGQGVGLADTCGDGQHRGAEQDGRSTEWQRPSPRRRDAERCDHPLFPPGPGELDAWRTILDRAPHLEPAVRRMADGMAARVDRLRMLGNGVVPLQAAYAVRTLATRLAERGSAGAARLVRMMGAAE
ncbi:MAG: DNA cytosine methyltransferase [Mesorhizobium sp.]|nr:MAG: DNA cytosine methyltransferase [Mesorhizobium sp.]